MEYVRLCVCFCMETVSLKMGGEYYGALDVEGWVEGMLGVCKAQVYAEEHWQECEDYCHDCVSLRHEQMMQCWNHEGVKMQDMDGMLHQQLLSLRVVKWKIC